MNLRTFQGATSRAVLEQIRGELGPDAMIVANRTTADGIEITAVAGNAMEALLNPNANARDPAKPRGRSAPSAETTLPVVVPAPAPAPAPAPIAATKVTRRPGVRSNAPKRIARPPVENPALTAKLMKEVASIRTFIEEQMAQLSLSDALRRRPLRAQLTREMLGAGYSALLTRKITARLPDDYSTTRAERWMRAVLARNLQAVDPAEEIVKQGGIYALIGPTGVGKTTTTAKLAARGAVRYGASQIALITTDSFRVGAQDQLRIYAKILGVTVHTVSDRRDLNAALESVRGRHLVLIDTVGMSQRDARVREQAMLLCDPDVKRLLLLSATADAETQDEVIGAYGQTPTSDGATALAGCILTKFDEAARTGPAIDAVIRYGLKLHFIANGQRVPEDLYAPNPQYLIDRSFRAPAAGSAHALDDDEIALRAGIPGPVVCHV